MRNSPGGRERKEKESPNVYERKAVPQTAYLHAVLWGPVTLNYHIQFYGLFYEKLLFSLSWIAVKGNRERQKRISITLVKKLSLCGLCLEPETACVPFQHFLRTFCEEVEASKTLELDDGKKRDTV